MAGESSCELHLDESVTVLQNLTLSTSHSETMLRMKEVNSIVDPKVQEDLLAHHGTSQNHLPNSSNSKNKRKGKQSASAGDKKPRTLKSSEVIRMFASTVVKRGILVEKILVRITVILPRNAAKI